MIPTLNILKAWDRFRGIVTRANQRNKMECHRRLVAAIGAFRLNDYVKWVRPLGEGGDRRKVVERELAELLSQREYAGKPGAELAVVTEREVQIRMPDAHVWWEVACLTHAQSFPKEAFLTVNTRSPRHFSQTHILSIAGKFPFMDQPFHVIARASPQEFPHALRLRVSGPLMNLLRTWAAQGKFPKEVLYSVEPTQHPSIDLDRRRQVGDHSVVTLPAGWMQTEALAE